MSRKVYKRVQVDSSTPLVFEEKPVVTGDGKRAFKSVTAAVRAAEVARDEVKAELAEARELAVAYRAGAEELLEAASGKLRRAERYANASQLKMQRWLLLDMAVWGVTGLVWGVVTVGYWLGWW